MTTRGISKPSINNQKRTSSSRPRNITKFPTVSRYEPRPGLHISTRVDDTHSAGDSRYDAQGCIQDCSSGVSSSHNTTPSSRTMDITDNRSSSSQIVTTHETHKNADKLLSSLVPNSRASTGRRGIKRKHDVTYLPHLPNGSNSTVSVESLAWSASNDRCATGESSLLPVNPPSTNNGKSVGDCADSLDMLPKNGTKLTDLNDENSFVDGFMKESDEAFKHATVVAHITTRNPDRSVSAGSNCLFETDPGSLVPPNCDTCFKMIRKTFHRLAKTEQQKSSFRNDAIVDTIDLKRKPRRVKCKARAKVLNQESSVEKIPTHSDHGTDESGASSGSGTEEGYAASASSTEQDAAARSYCSQTSEESSEESGNEQLIQLKPKFTLSGDPNRPMLSKKSEAVHSSSSEIADFSSATSGAETDSIGSENILEFPAYNGIYPYDDDELQGSPFKRHASQLKQKSRATSCPSSSIELQPVTMINHNNATLPKTRFVAKETKNLSNSRRGQSKPTDIHPLMNLGCDVMAHILTFLHPPDILYVLTMPISKTWLATYSRQTELWRVLCLLEPFKAKVEHANHSTDYVDSFPFNDDTGRKQYFGKFRLLYTSFVRCMRYLIRIKDDAVNGRSTSANDFGTLDGRYHNISANRSLHNFLSQARGAMATTAYSTESPRLTEEVARAAPINLSDEESLAATMSIAKKDVMTESKEERKVRYGHSKLTQRLLGPAANGIVRDVELPWSCGIFSIVNWMVAFTDVEGIQTMCLKVLPFLLENEQQRVTAQRAGLTDIVLRAMVLFPNSSQLHTAAFHTIVILARPLGGQEGMLLHTSMVSSFGIFKSHSGAQDGRNGVAVLLDSMRRFRSDNILQSMGCWSLVNVALAPSQKMILVTSGGIEVIIQAMTDHPYDAELQFRALFALINLVIPTAATVLDQDDSRNGYEVQASFEIRDNMVNPIAQLVVLAMKNFSSNEAILNRACLVLHNLSLTPECNEALLWTPGCYQMLEWCLANFRADQVLQQSAAGTLHRLQTTLSRSEAVRERFNSSIRAQQQSSLERAHAEAVRLHRHYVDAPQD